MFSGEPAAALPHLEHALRLTTGAANIHFYYFWLGLDHLLMKQTDQAVECFRKASAALPQSPGYHLALASALGLRGDIAEAKANLDKAFSLGSELNSMTKILSQGNFRLNRDPKFVALRKKTFDAGLLRAGMPEQ